MRIRSEEEAAFGLEFKRQPDGDLRPQARLRGGFIKSADQGKERFPVDGC